MRIAQVSPLCESIPPRRYGGTERVVHFLTEELVRRGHEVMLFASGDSRTSAELFPCVPEALRLAGYDGDPTVRDEARLALEQLEDPLVLERLHEALDEIDDVQQVFSNEEAGA